jgi:hypothetical protein
MAVAGANLSSAQETNIYNRMDQEEDLWMILFTVYTRSRVDQIEDLKTRFIDATAEWQAEAQKARQQGFGDLKQLASEKTLQWNIRMKQYLGDPGMVTLLRIHLRSLLVLRSKRINTNDPASNARKQINTVLSQLADFISLAIDPYLDMTRCLERNQTPGGKDLTDVSRNYYQMRQNEYFNLISTYMALVIFLKTAVSSEDLVRCQDLARRNLIKPLELKIDTLDKSDKKEAWSKLDNYSKLIRSLDIQLE